MGKQKTKKFAAMKRMINLKDNRIKEKDRAKAKEKKKKDPAALKETEVPKHPSCLFFQYNTQLGPPYHILVDTNFINFSIKAKLDIVQSMMDCLYAKCIPYITDCVMAEIEKLGMKYRVALRIAKDPRFERLPCTHKGTYADDCLVQRVTQHKCYILATVDRDLKRRVRKIPGVPIMYISNHRHDKRTSDWSPFSVEHLNAASVAAELIRRAVRMRGGRRSGECLSLWSDADPARSQRDPGASA
ncbi:hypothetical protein L3Q82_026626 [Scortum barcoo]|uniref:Uncharacterized protein n=1 Tax=Scortum barcoo TaxID=214431 RepID=A0ACB8WJ04_9TELE|nr:hypothetical protein L3Q82_026626 [Scortum barcoo]